MLLPPVVHPVLAGLAGVTSAWLTVLARRVRDDRETDAFVGLTGGATLWALSYAVALLVHDPTLRWGVELLIWTGRLTVPVAWLLFALEYTGRSELLTRTRIAAICLFPAVTLLALVSNPVTGILFENYRIVGETVATVQYTRTTYFWVQLLYSYTLIGTGTVVLFGMVLSPERLFSVQAGALVVGALVPTVTNVLWLFDWGPVPGIDLTPAALSVTCGSFAVALLRFDLLGLSPKPQRLGWRAAVADFDDSVLVVGTDGRVVDANPSAESLFPDRDPFGEAVTDLLDEQDLPDDGTITLGLDTSVGRRRYEITVSPVADRQGLPIGQTFVLRDITEREQREQRLSVLNRVLRHNLRNDMNVIHGSATAADGATEQDESYIETVTDHAAELVELSETARTIQRVVDADPSQTQEIDVQSFVEEVVSEVARDAADGDGVGDRTAADEATLSVEMDVPAGITLSANRSVVRAITLQALENAAKHGDGRARVACRETGDWIEFVIADDGPGLPDLERRAIRTETETDLIHSGGLGLWLIRWGTRTLGGDLSVATSKWDGTELRIRLPRDRRVSSGVVGSMSAE